MVRRIWLCSLWIFVACAAENEEAFEGRLELVHADPAVEEEGWVSTTWRLVEPSGRTHVLDLGDHELGGWHHGSTVTVRGDAGFEPPVAETCNDQDDDCDGVVDEGAPEISIGRDEDRHGAVDECDVCARPNPRPAPERDGDESDGDEPRREGGDAR